MATTSSSRAQLFAWFIGLLLLAAPQAVWAGSIVVSNHTVIPLMLTDEKASDLGQVGAGRSVSIVFEAGQHTLKAMRLDGTAYTETQLTLGETGGVKWQILPTEGVVEIRNLTTEPMTILVDDQPLVDIRASDLARIDGIRPGKRALKAVYNGNVIAVDVADITPNGIYVWRLTQSGLSETLSGMIRVANFSGDDVDIYVDGNKRIGIHPGDTAAMVGIPAGVVNLEAQTPKGIVISKTELDLSTEPTQRWVVTGPDGGYAVVDIKNQTDNALRICVDGSYCMRIAAKGVVHYDGIKPGRHTFQAYNLREDRLLKAVDLDLTVGTPYRWVVEQPE